MTKQNKSECVGKNYFVSPRYFGSTRNPHNLSKETLDKLAGFDLKDTFNFWLENNSLLINDSSYINSRGEIEYSDSKRLFLFNGTNGVLCEVRSTKIDIEREPGTKYDPYARVVRIKHMPFGKGIPSELENKLGELGYKSPILVDTKLITEAERIFRITYG